MAIPIPGYRARALLTSWSALPSEAPVRDLRDQRRNGRETSEADRRPAHLCGAQGERYRNGERIASGFVESAVNQVVSKRMVKRHSAKSEPAITAESAAYFAPGGTSVGFTPSTLDKMTHSVESVGGPGKCRL